MSDEGKHPVKPANQRGAARLDLLVSKDKHQRHLLLLRKANLVLHAIGRVINAHADPGTAQDCGACLSRFEVAIGNGDDHHLFRR